MARKRIKPGKFSEAFAASTPEAMRIPFPTSCRCQSCHSAVELVQRHIRVRADDQTWSNWLVRVRKLWSLVRIAPESSAIRGLPEMPGNDAAYGGRSGELGYPSDYGDAHPDWLIGWYGTAIPTGLMRSLQVQAADSGPAPFLAHVAMAQWVGTQNGTLFSVSEYESFQALVHAGRPQGISSVLTERRNTVAFFATLLAGRPDYSLAIYTTKQSFSYYGAEWSCEGLRERRRGPSTNHAKARAKAIVSRPNRGERLTGLELEHNIHHKGFDSWIRSWPGAAYVSDGSCGREAVTPPLFGYRLLRCLTEACDVLRLGRDPVDERCSVHVHVDATDFSWPDMLRLMAVWRKVEPLMFVLGGQSRISNTYCRTVSSDVDAVMAAKDRKLAAIAIFAMNQTPLHATATEPGTGRLHKGYSAVKTFMASGLMRKKSSGRYRALNISPWLAARTSTGTRPDRDGIRGVGPRKDATVEFRLHQNCANPHRLYQWATLLSRLMSWVAVASDRDVAKLPGTPLRALVHMVPESRDWILRRIAAWREASRFASQESAPDDASETTVYVPRQHRLKFLANNNVQASLPMMPEEF